MYRGGDAPDLRDVERIESDDAEVLVVEPL